MKTAISNVIFERTDLFTKQVKKSRSGVVGEALAKYLARHAPDEVTEAMNLVVDQLESDSSAFSDSASRRLLKRVEC